MHGRHSFNMIQEAMILDVVIGLMALVTLPGCPPKELNDYQPKQHVIWEASSASQVWCQQPFQLHHEGPQTLAFYWVQTLATSPVLQVDSQLLPSTSKLDASLIFQKIRTRWFSVNQFNRQNGPAIAASIFICFHLTSIH